jgi:transposase
MDKQIEALCEKEYPETATLRGIKGVGPITSLAFVLTLEEKGRFANSRSVPAYLGLTPRRDQSGEVDKQLRITKAGDRYLRRLLISCAHYILGPFGGPSHLRAFGERLCVRGGKNAKKRATVAVARKLAVVMHTLWVGEAEYDPFHAPPGCQAQDKASGRQVA